LQHHEQILGDVLDHREVVADEKIRVSPFAPEILEEIEHLCLRGDVQCADRFITDDELWLDRQRLAMAMRWR
jgi:hypothetical protein